MNCPGRPGVRGCPSVGSSSSEVTLPLSRFLPVTRIGRNGVHAAAGPVAGASPGLALVAPVLCVRSGLPGGVISTHRPMGTPRARWCAPARSPPWFYGRACKTMLKGVSVARLTLWKPPAPITSRTRASPRREYPVAITDRAPRGEAEGTADDYRPMRLLRRLGPGHHRRKADELAVMFRLVLGPVKYLWSRTTSRNRSSLAPA
jgi:hypothetical protein